MKKLIITLLAFLVVPAFAGGFSPDPFPPGSPKYADSFEKVTEAAKKSGKPMILIFSAEWGAPMQYMKKDVYPSKLVQAFHDKLEWAYLDIDSEVNLKVMKSFVKHDTVPAYVFLDKNGGLLGSDFKLKTPEEFSKILQDMLNKAAKKP